VEVEPFGCQSNFKAKLCEPKNEVIENRSAMVVGPSAASHRSVLQSCGHGPSPVLICCGNAKIAATLVQIAPLRTFHDHLCIGWYLRFSLSYRDVEDLLTERGLPVDHTTVWRWVQCYAPKLNKRCRRELKPNNRSWRVDETYIRVKGKWTYLYRAVDSAGATIDFLLAARRDAAAAKRFFQNALLAPWSSSAQGVQRRRQPVLSQGRGRTEAGGQTRPAVPLPYQSLLEQHRGAGSSSDQTTG
jgi:hypothetical protein